MLPFDIMPNMVTEREKTEAYYEYVKRLMQRCYEAVNEVPGLRGSNGKITYTDFVKIMGQGLVELGVFTPEEVCLKTANLEVEPQSDNMVYKFLDCEYNSETRMITAPSFRITLQTRLAIPFSAIISRQGGITSNDNIGLALKQVGFSSSPESIRSTIHELRRKLENCGLPEGLIVATTGVGYKFSAEVTAIQRSNPSVQPAVRT